MSDTIIRVKHDVYNPYVIINKSIFKDTRLSWKAKGLHAYLISQPDDWRVMISDLVNRSTDGRDSVYAGLNELIKYKYIKRECIRENGRIRRWEYTVYEIPYEDETPLPDFPEEEQNQPLPEKPYQENPFTENPTLLNNDITNIDLTNNINNRGKETEAAHNDFVDDVKSANSDNTAYTRYLTDKDSAEKGLDGQKKEEPRYGAPTQHVSIQSSDNISQDCAKIKPKPKVFSAADATVSALKQDIDAATGGSIALDAVRRLLARCGESQIRYYITNFDKFRQSHDINNAVGFFIKAVEERYPLPVSSAKKNKWNNFEQRDNDFQSIEKAIQDRNRQRFSLWKDKIPRLDL